MLDQQIADSYKTTRAMLRKDQHARLMQSLICNLLSVDPPYAYLNIFSTLSLSIEFPRLHFVRNDAISESRLLARAAFDVPLPFAAPD